MSRTTASAISPGWVMTDGAIACHSWGDSSALVCWTISVSTQSGQTQLMRMLELREGRPPRGEALDHPRVVHQDVQPTEALAGALDHHAYVALVRHIRPDRHRATCRLFDQPCRVLRARRIDVGGDDRGAVTREPQRGGSADSGAGAGDEGDCAGDVHRA